MIDWSKFSNGWATGSMKCEKCSAIFQGVRFFYSCHDKVAGEWPQCCGQSAKFCDDWKPEPILCECSTCGFKWERGRDGSHDCTTQLRAKLKLKHLELTDTRLHYLIAWLGLRLGELRRDHPTIGAIHDMHAEFIAITIDW